MNNDVKIALGCFGVALFETGGIVMGYIKDKTIKSQDMVIKTLRNEYLNVCKENDILREK